MDVAVVAGGHTPFGTLGRTGKDLFTEAVLQCVDSADRGLDPAAIQESWVGSLGFGGWQLGNLAALVGEHARIPGIPARRVEDACASSGFAFRDAYLAVKSGQVEVALAGGVEVMNDVPPTRQRYWLGVSGDTEWERLAGLTFPGVYAMMAVRHMHEFGTTREQLAAVAVKNHRNGARNPNAQFRKEITVEDALRSPSVAYPFTLYDCCATTDGATAVVLASADRAKEFTDTPVWVLGSGAATDRLALHDRETLTALDATRRAASDALRRADVRLKDIDVAELHDCFTIAEILALEDIGWCPKGQGGPFTERGATALDGQVAVNPSGGLKAKGHPLGATGTAQVYEIFRQLRGEGEGRQRADAEIGLTHNVGGSGATCAVHIFAR
ncbi:MAG TPA: thiolase domain-containing protein [Thermoplasmata archaeon]|nr:thiolase domain-containing protein [Thermoplasmata archaeon]